MQEPDPSTSPQFSDRVRTVAAVGELDRFLDMIIARADPPSRRQVAIEIKRDFAYQFDTASLDDAHDTAADAVCHLQRVGVDSNEEEVQRVLNLALDNVIDAETEAKDAADELNTEKLVTAFMHGRRAWRWQRFIEALRREKFDIE